MKTTPSDLHPYNANLLSDVTLMTRRNANQLQVERRADEFADPTKTKVPPHDSAILGEALVWPLFLGERNCLTPAVGFGAAIFAMQFAYPEAKVGAVVLASYGFSAAVYVAQFISAPPVSQLKGGHPEYS